MISEIKTREDLKNLIFDILQEMQSNIDATIPSLPALVTQSLDDVYEVSDRLGINPSVKESRAQILSFTNANAQITESQVSGITFQTTYNTSGSFPGFQIGTGGFSIQDSSSNYLFLLNPSSPGYSLSLSSQHGVSLSNLANDGFTSFLGDQIVNYIPSDVGVGNPCFTAIFQSKIPGNDFGIAGKFQYGFSDESAPSGFYKLIVTDNGSDNNILYATGAASGNLPRVGINGQLTVGIGYGSSSNKMAAIQIGSTTQAMMPAVWNSTQESTNISLLGSGDAGLSWYNSTIDVPVFWDGLDRQQILAIDNIIQGSNMTITNNGDGTVTFASSGGGSAGTQVQGTFASGTSAVTSVTTSPMPINIASGFFQVINSVGTSVTTASISGVTTAIIQNTSTGGRWGTACFDLTMNFSTTGSSVFIFTVYTNKGSTYFSKRFTLDYNIGTEKGFTFASPLVYLDTGDYLYLTVACGLGSTSFSAATFQGNWIDTTIAGLPSTDPLSQGTNNLYASTNGGTTWQYLSGTATIGHLAQFNSAGGQLIDSGLAVSSGILTATGFIGNTLTSNSANDLTLATPLPSSTVNANSIFLNASNGNSSRGGNISLSAGNGDSANGGNLNLYAGNGFGGNAGLLVIQGGLATSGHTSGQVQITGGSGGGSGSDSGADVIITGGTTGSGGFGGNVRVRGGITTGGTNGSVIFDQGNVNFPNQIASQALVLNSSKNVTTLGYGSTNTASTLVERDGNGNFSAGTITATLFVGTPANDAYYYTTCGGL